MAKPISFKKPGAPKTADLDAFVSGGQDGAPTAPVEVSNSTGSQVSVGQAESHGKTRKADAWGMPRPGEKIAKLGVDLTPEVRQAFRAKAISEGRDGADLIREWIRAYLEN